MKKLLIFLPIVLLLFGCLDVNLEVSVEDGDGNGTFLCEMIMPYMPGLEKEKGIQLDSSGKAHKVTKIEEVNFKKHKIVDSDQTFIKKSQYAREPSLVTMKTIKEGWFSNLQRIEINLKDTLDKETETEKKPETDNELFSGLEEGLKASLIDHYLTIKLNLPSKPEKIHALKLKDMTITPQSQGTIVTWKIPLLAISESKGAINNITVDFWAKESKLEPVKEAKEKQEEIRNAYNYGSSKKAANYYRKAILDRGTHSIMGKYPVADEMAKKINCYHFVYDDKDRLIKVEYLKVGVLQNDNVFGVAEIEIEYSNNYEKRIYKNPDGKPVYNKLGVYSNRYKSDENNRRISLFNYDEQGNLAKDRYGVTQYLWTVDEYGRKINSIRINEKGERIVDNQGLYELRYKYDKKGNQIEVSNHWKDGQLFEGNHGFAITRFEYDEHGNPVEIRFLGTDEQLKEHKEWGFAIAQSKYDENGKRIKTMIFDSNQKLLKELDS